MSPEADQVLDHLKACKSERERRVLRGAVIGDNAAEVGIAYKAAVAEIRLIDGVIAKFDAVFNKKEIAEQSDSGVTEMPEDKG